MAPVAGLLCGEEEEDALSSVFFSAVPLDHIPAVPPHHMIRRHGQAEHGRHDMTDCSPPEHTGGARIIPMANTRRLF